LKHVNGKHIAKNLTRYTANAFIVTTQSNISAAKYLIDVYDFPFVLPGCVNSQSPLEKFFLYRLYRCPLCCKGATTSPTFKV